MLSWTFSKVLPYLITFIIGAILFWIFSKVKSKIRHIRFIIWIVPFTIYFSLNPIYQGDFSNNYYKIDIKKLPVKSYENELIVLTIPGCPYCHASIETLKILKQRNPRLDIKFIVCNSDSLSTKEYKHEIQNLFPVKHTLSPKKWAKIAQGKFPSFLLVDEKQVKIWSNDGFGVRAKDEIESVVSSN